MRPIYYVCGTLLSETAARCQANFTRVQPYDGLCTVPSFQFRQAQLNAEQTLPHSEIYQLLHGSSQFYVKEDQSPDQLLTAAFCYHS